MKIVDNHEIFRTFLTEVHNEYVRHFQTKRKKTIWNLFGLIKYPSFNEIVKFADELIIDKNRCVFKTYVSIQQNLTIDELDLFLYCIELNASEYHEFAGRGEIDYVSSLRVMLANSLRMLAIMKIMNIWRYNLIKGIGIKDLVLKPHK